MHFKGQPIHSFRNPTDCDVNIAKGREYVILDFSPRADLGRQHYEWNRKHDVCHVNLATFKSLKQSMVPGRRPPKNMPSFIAIARMRFMDILKLFLVARIQHGTNKAFNQSRVSRWTLAYELPAMHTCTKIANASPQCDPGY
jgi:hypothetical protein